MKKRLMVFAAGQLAVVAIGYALLSVPEIVVNPAGQQVFACGTDSECEALNPHAVDADLVDRACGGGTDLESAQLAPFVECE